MSLLVKKAAQEAFNNLQRAYAHHVNMSDDLHDIRMYLDANKVNLPDKGEVTIKELFVMFDSVISNYKSIDDELTKTNEWLNAIINSK